MKPPDNTSIFFFSFALAERDKDRLPTLYDSIGKALTACRAEKWQNTTTLAANKSRNRPRVEIDKSANQVEQHLNIYQGLSR